VDGKKYYDNNDNYNLMKKISDGLCEKNNLSVIRNPKSKGKALYRSAGGEKRIFHNTRANKR